MMTLPNLSCLHIPNRAAPTSGTGGGPGGGGAAAREVHGQDDVLALVGDHLRRFDPEAVPESQRVSCVAKLHVSVSEVISHMGFTVAFAHGGRPTLSTDSVLEGFREALSGAIESVLEDPWGGDLSIKAALKSGTQSRAERSESMIVYSFAKINLVSRSDDEFYAHRVLERLNDAWIGLDGSRKSKRFFDALMNGVLQTLRMTLLKNSYDLWTAWGPDYGGQYKRVVHFDAVRNADIPHTFPNEANAPDDRTKKLLQRLRALVEGERARAAVGQV